MLQQGCRGRPERPVRYGPPGGFCGPLTGIWMSEPPAQLVTEVVRARERREEREQLVAFAARVAEERHPAGGHLDLTGAHRPASLDARGVLRPVEVRADLR